VKNVLLDKVRSGVTVIMTTHILEVAERMASASVLSPRAGSSPRARSTSCAAQARHGGNSLEDIFLDLVAENAATEAAAA